MCSDHACGCACLTSPTMPHGPHSRSPCASGVWSDLKSDLGYSVRPHGSQRGPSLSGTQGALADGDESALLGVVIQPYRHPSCSTASLCTISCKDHTAILPMGLVPLHSCVCCTLAAGVVSHHVSRRIHCLHQTGCAMNVCVAKAHMCCFKHGGVLPCVWGIGVPACSCRHTQSKAEDFCCAVRGLCRRG